MPSEQQPQTYVCPSCGETIDHLDYEADVTSYGWESGSADFDGSFQDFHDGETHDSEYNGDCSYKCPECNEDIGLPPYEEYEGENDEDEQPPREEPPRDMEEHPTASFWESSKNYPVVKMFTCPECSFTRQLDEGEEELICDRCWSTVKVDESNTAAY